MKSTETEAGKYYGYLDGKKYLINDDSAGYFYELWQQNKPEEVVEQALQNTALWGTNLDALPGFTAAVQKHLLALISKGIWTQIKILESEKVSA